jgi:hypothetical protein
MNEINVFGSSWIDVKNAPYWHSVLTNILCYKLDHSANFPILTLIHNELCILDRKMVTTQVQHMGLLFVSTHYMLLLRRNKTERLVSILMCPYS